VILVALAQAAGPELTVWHAYRGAERDALEAVGRLYTERSGQEVRFVELPFGAFGSKVETAIPRGNGPDLFVASHDNLGKWIGMGLVEPLPSAPIGHLPATVEALTIDGRTWGQPLAYKSVLLLYDPARVPVPPADTDALIAAARQARAQGGYGLAWEASEPYFHGPVMHAFGARALEAGGGARLDTPEHEAAMAFSRRLAVDEGIAPAQPNGALIGQLYDEGQLAFVFSGPWFVPDRSRPIAAARAARGERDRSARPPLPHGRRRLPRPRRGAPTGGERAHHVPVGRGGRGAAGVGGPPGREPARRGDGRSGRGGAHRPGGPERADAVHPDTGTMFESQARALRSVMRGAATPEEARRRRAGAGSTSCRGRRRAEQPAPYDRAGGAGGPRRAGGAGALGAGGAKRLVAHAWDYAWVGRRPSCWRRSW
jgi:hypothetical protein